MKLSNLAIFSVVLFSNAMFASSDGCCRDDQSHAPKYRARYSANYRRMIEKFDEGKAFDFQASLGWYSGRCWRWNSETPLNGLLVMEQRETDGPEFPPVNKFFFYQMEGQPEDFFEKHSLGSHASHTHKGLSKQQGMLHEWQKAIARNFQNDWDDITKVSEAEGGGYTSTYARLAPMIVRKTSDDKYFVLKSSDTLICYFFEPVQAGNGNGR